MQVRHRRRSSLSSRMLALIVLTIAPVQVGSAEDSWPAFQNGGVLAVPQADLPLKWSPSEGIAWRTKLAGYGQPSPVVKEDLIYVTSTSGEMKEHLHVEAIDLRSGEQVWRVDAKNSSPEKSTNYVSRAAPSPVCDTAGVIALFEGGNVIALTPDGKMRWERDLVADFGEIKARHGLGSSLEQDETRVFAWIERQEQPYILALSKKTGKTIWESAGIGVTSWSSPRLVSVGEGRHLVLSGIGKLTGLDPKTGKQLWHLDDISGNSTPTPVPLGSGRFLIGATEGRGQSSGGNAAASNGVVQIEETEDGKFEARFVWHAKKATSSFGSPVAHQGYACFVNRSGVVYCLDLETGAEQYAQRSSSSIWATPLAAGNRLYLFGRNGTTTVIKSGPKFESLAVNELWATGTQGDSSNADENDGLGSAVLYAAAAVGSDLILRRGDFLYSIAR